MYMNALVTEHARDPIVLSVKKWPQIPVGIYESKAEGERVSRQQRFARLLRARESRRRIGMESGD